jgi:hypothetical protein
MKSTLFGALCSLTHTLKLLNLHERSKFEYIVLGARSDDDSLDTPVVHFSVVGGDFMTHYLRFEPTILARHFDAYATTHGGLSGGFSGKPQRLVSHVSVVYIFQES